MGFESLRVSIINHGAMYGYRYVCVYGSHSVSQLQEYYDLVRKVGSMAFNLQKRGFDNPLASEKVKVFFSKF